MAIKTFYCTKCSLGKNLTLEYEFVPGVDSPSTLNTPDPALSPADNTDWSTVLLPTPAFSSSDTQSVNSRMGANNDITTTLSGVLTDIENVLSPRRNSPPMDPTPTSESDIQQATNIMSLDEAQSAKEVVAPVTTNETEASDQPEPVAGPSRGSDENLPGSEDDVVILASRRWTETRAERREAMRSLIRTTCRKRTTVIQECKRAKSYGVREVLKISEREDFDYYYIQWDNGERTWEPFENCKGCIGAINKLRRRLNMPLLPEKYGADTEENVNRNNWIDMKTILAAVDKFDRVKDCFPPVAEFTGPNKNPIIQLLGHSNHVFVIYRSPGSGKIFIADGTDYYISDKRVEREVNKIIGTSFVFGIPFIGQSAIDHCASSAVAIALEFRRAFRQRQEPPANIKAERTTLDRIRKLFHPEPSVSVPSEGPLRNLAPDICSVCGKQFNSRDRRAYSMHIRNHK